MVPQMAEFEYIEWETAFLHKQHSSVLILSHCAKIKDFAACKHQLRIKIKEKKDILIVYNQYWTIGSVLVNVYK